MIRTDFVSNSSSSSFMIDEESYNKCDVIIPDSLNPYTTTFYGFIDHYIYLDTFYLKFENFTRNDFKIIDDEKFCKFVADGSYSHHMVPKSLENKLDEYIDLRNKKSRDATNIREIIRSKMIDLVKSKIKDFNIIEFSGADDEYIDDSETNLEDYAHEVYNNILNACSPKFSLYENCH